MILVDAPKGSGKTLWMMDRMCNLLSQGCICGTNIPVIVPGLKEFLRARYKWELQEGQLILLDNEKLMRFWEHIPFPADGTAYAFLDEIGRKWNARDWAKTQRELLDFLALARHECLEIFLSDQHANNVDKQFRRLLQFYVHIRDLEKSSRGWVPFTVRWVLWFDYDGKTSVDREFWFADKRLYKTYDSKDRTMVTFKRLHEGAKVGDGRIKGGSGMIKWLFVIVICLGGVFYGFHHFATHGVMGEKRGVASSGFCPIPIGGSGSKTNPVPVSARARLSSLEDYRREGHLLNWCICGKRLVLPEGRYEVGDVCPLGRVYYIGKENVVIQNGLEYRVVRLWH